MKMLKRIKSVSRGRPSAALIVAALIAMLTVSGCNGVRFVIDAVPAEDHLAETEVLADDGVSTWGGAKIALIDVRGMIIDARKPGLLVDGENPVAALVESLQKAKDDSKVKAIVLRINSPGGTVTASDMMYREVNYFKQKSGKPVVVLMGGVTASGGYYLACAGDELIAHPTSITGSIGVIIQTINFSEGMRRIGIKAESITSGPNKAVGSPFEPMPEEHRELLQGLVNEFYASFRGIVETNRPGISESDLQWVTDGRVVTGNRAVEVGLVDSVGDLHDAFAAAKRRAGVQTARLVKYHRPLEYVGSPYARSPIDGAGAEINLLQVNLDASPTLGSTAFYYLWEPTAW